MRWREYISTSNWAYNMLALVALLIPIHKRFVPLAIVLAAVVAIVKSIRNFTRPDLRAWLPMVGLVLLYLLLLASISEWPLALEVKRELETKASLVAIPAMFLLVPVLGREHREKVMDVFAAGCLLFLLFALGYATRQAIGSGNVQHFFYKKVAVIYHPTYMAMYQSLALVWMLRTGLRQEYWFRHKALHWSLCVAIVVYITLLSSKAGLLSGLIALGIAAWPDRHDRLTRRRAVTTSGILAALLVILSVMLPGTAARLSRATQDTAAATGVERPVEGGATSSTALRLVTWKAAWNVLLENPLGVGVGNTSPALAQVYAKEGEEYAMNRSLPAHNQFLQTGAESGWPGLVVLVLLCAWLMHCAVRRRDMLFQAFAVLCIVNFMFESCLEIQEGVVFFCFFTGFFLLPGSASDKPRG